MEVEDFRTPSKAHTPCRQKILRRYYYILRRIIGGCKVDMDHDPNTIIRAFQNSQSSDVESHSLSVGNLAGADRIGESQRPPQTC